MNNAFQRTVDIDSLRDKEVAAFTPEELVAYLTIAYPYDPLGALQWMRDSYVVGTVLGEQTRLLLEGLRGVKTN